jgi:DNA polymerase III subunit beta
LIPASQPTEWTLAADELARAVAIAAVYARQGSGIARLRATGERLRAWATTTEGAKGDSELEINVEGDDQQVAVNVRYLGDALKAFAGARVRIGLKSPSEQVTFRDESGDYVHVVMPMFAQWEE